MPCQYQETEHQNGYGTTNVTEPTDVQVLDVCSAKIILLCSEINVVYGQFRPICSTGPLVEKVRLLEQIRYFHIFKFGGYVRLKQT